MAWSYLLCIGRTMLNAVAFRINSICYFSTFFAASQTGFDVTKVRSVRKADVPPLSHERSNTKPEVHLSLGAARWNITQDRSEK
jgi:hypothetical protein